MRIHRGVFRLHADARPLLRVPPGRRCRRVLVRPAWGGLPPLRCQVARPPHLTVHLPAHPCSFLKPKHGWKAVSDESTLFFTSGVLL